jgi:hypothetical protein
MSGRRSIVRTAILDDSQTEISAIDVCKVLAKQPATSIARRHRIHPTTGKHRGTSTNPGDTRTGDRMHNEKSRTVWSHCQQGLPCLPAVAPTPSGAFHAPRVKSASVWNYSINATEASDTDDRLNWRSCLILFVPLFASAHSCVSARRYHFASSFVAPTFASPLLPFGMGVVVHLRLLSGLRPMVDLSLYIGIRPCVSFHVLACDADFLFTEV